jgi:hypothetical protein
MRLALALIGKALVFSREHPVLHTVALWFFVLPGMAMSVLLRLLTAYHDLLLPPSVQSPPFAIIVIVGGGIIIFWGIGCVLSIAKSALRTGSGRSPLSLGAIRTQGKSLLPRLFLTELLQECVIILWGFLLVFPGIVVLIRTALVPVIVGFEGIAFRPALQRSRELVLGHTWKTGWALLWLWILLFLPVLLVSEAISSVAESQNPHFLFAVDLLENGLMAVSMVFQNLCLVFLYEHLKIMHAPDQ